MRAADTAALGASGVRVSRLGVGAGTLSHAAGAAALHATLDRAFASGLRYVDTAPLYLGGGSEQHVGDWLSTVEREDIVVSTKVGRLADGPDGRRFDYSADAARESVATSLERLHTDHLDLVVVHDLDTGMHGEAFEQHYRRVVEGCWPALTALRDAGVIRALGVSTRETDVALRVLDDLGPDMLMMAGSYTLLAHEPAEELLPECVRREVAVLVASPFNTGILATGDPESPFDYAPAPPAIRTRLRGLLDIGQRHGVALAAAALQFPLRNPAVASVVAGHRVAAELDANIAGIESPIPEDYWSELADAGLIPSNRVEA